MNSPIKPLPKRTAKRITALFNSVLCADTMIRSAHEKNDHASWTRWVEHQADAARALKELGILVHCHGGI